MSFNDAILCLKLPPLARASRSCPQIKQNHCSCGGFIIFSYKNHYIYQYRDHLGNARVSFAKNSEGALEITDANNYYPFGLNHIEGMLSTSNFGGYYSYKYNGKELQETGDV
ncbi:hypothetical protein [Chryseobacterium sp.]|uniref:hypothetical protein n=1 Tax=Chryseobacterium sp. TaxID=1871047 RepID=UPI00345C02D2